MSFHVLRPDELEFVERQSGDEPARRVADLTGPGALEHSRARLWYYPPHSQGRRHREMGQEEVFVVLQGTLTMLVGEPPERVEVGPRGVVAVHIGTPLQVRNDADEELALFVYGAPPVTGLAELLEDA